MSQLAADIALLDRVAGICGRVIFAEPEVTVPEKTLQVLADEIATARKRCAEYRLIDDEAVFLVTAARRIVWARDEGNDVLRERWTRIGELLRAAIEVDLHNARQSLGGVG